jgi:hypothetical protein
MMGIFNTSAYKIITQYLYANDRFVNKAFYDLTNIGLELFISTIVLDDYKLFCLASSLTAYRKEVNNEIILSADEIGAVKCG